MDTARLAPTDLEEAAELRHAQLRAGIITPTRRSADDAALVLNTWCTRAHLPVWVEMTSTGVGRGVYYIWIMSLPSGKEFYAAKEARLWEAIDHLPRIATVEKLRHILRSCRGH